MAVDATTGKPLWTFRTNADVAGLADDLHVRRPAAHRDRRRRQHPRRSRCRSRSRPHAYPARHAAGRHAGRDTAAGRADRDHRQRQGARVALPARRQDRLLPRRAVRLVGPGLEPDVERPRVLRPVVRPATIRRCTTPSRARSRSSCTGDTAPGYAEAAAGGTFVRIGVGVLRKPAGETSLQRFGRYEIVDPGTWTTEAGQGSDRVRPRAEEPGRLRLRLPQGAAPRRRLADPRARAEEHRDEARSPPASTTTTSSRSTARRPGRTSWCASRSRRRRRAR